MSDPDLFGWRHPPKPKYPEVPGHVDQATSIAAALSMEPSAGTLRAMILDRIRASGDYGMTCDEVEVVFQMRHQTASARIRELAMGGKIKDSESTRNTRSGRKAIVWVMKNARG